MDLKYKFHETNERLRNYAIANPNYIEDQQWVSEVAINCGVERRPRPFDLVPVAEAIIKSAQIKTEFNNGHIACYIPPEDRITIPKIKLFKSQAGYYSTMFHELGHSTGQPWKLNRQTLTYYAVDEEFQATEELVAELTAAYILNTIGLDNTRKNATYVVHWAGFTSNPNEAISWASVQAAKAAEYLLKQAY